MPFLSIRFTLILAVSISVFDFLGDVFYFTVTLLEGGGQALGFERYSLLSLSIAILTLPSILYACLLGFPRAFVRAWLEAARSFPQWLLRLTFGTRARLEKLSETRAVASPSACFV